MATRRSSRIKDIEDRPEPAPVPVKPAPVKKRKTPATADSDGVKNQKKAKTVNKATKVVASTGGSKLGLSSLPQEILDLTVKNIGDPKSISALGRTCKALYDLMMPRLYQRVVAAAMFHAHIAKLIRTLQPHLSIAQSKQLIKEGKYKGQPAKHPGGVDPNVKPLCAGYVRDVVIGVCDPGKKHAYIVERYIEEALKNFANAERVQTWTITEPIAKQIADMSNLKAFCLQMHNHEEDNLIEPLAKIKGLEHLHISDMEYGITYRYMDVVLSMLANSRLTLKSLNFHVPRLTESFLRKWRQLVPKSKDSENKFEFPHLKTFTAGPLRVDDDALEWFQGIDYVNLHELSLNISHDFKGKLANHIADEVTSTLAAGREVKIKSLAMNMASSDDSSALSWQRTMADKDQLRAKLRLVGSFSTLQKFSLKEYGMYPENTPNPGMDSGLLDAVFKHKHLRSFNMSYTGIYSGVSIAYLKEDDVRTILKNLPELEEFTFAPQAATKEEAEGIGRALATGKNLRVIDMFTLEFRETIKIEDIIQEFLGAAEVSDGKPFVWEDHYKLRRIITNEYPCEIGSKLGKLPKGAKKVKTETASRDVGGRTRQVQHREALRFWSIHVGYDEHFTWLERISRPLYRRG